MSETAGIEGPPVGDGTGSSENGQTPGHNPAWNEFLGVIPQDLHQQVIPHLQKWDKGVNERFQQVHSQYEPWKPLIEQGVNPDQVTPLLQFSQKFEENPREVLEALAQFAGAKVSFGDDEQGQLGDETGEQNSDSNDIWSGVHPKVKELVLTMAQAIDQGYQQEQIQQEEAQLDAELTELREKNKDKGPFDERWVMTQMIANEDMSLEDAVNSYYEWKEQQLADMQRPKAPTILGGGGTAGASNGVDVTKLSSQDTKALVAKYAAALSSGEG